jgi:hypothetical protein
LPLFLSDLSCCFGILLVIGLLGNAYFLWYIISMKETLKSLLVYALVVYFVFTLFAEGIVLPENPTYVLLTVLVLSFTVMISCPLLNFLTVKCKFPTFFLMTTLLLVGITYVLKLFMVGFFIESYTFEGLDLGSMRVESFEVVPIISIIAFSLVSSFICSVYRELDATK